MVRFKSCFSIALLLAALLGAGCGSSQSGGTPPGGSPNPDPPNPQVGHPNLSVSAWDNAATTSAYARFKTFNDLAVTNAGSTPPLALPYGFSAMDALVQWQASAKDPLVTAGQRQKYRALALNLVRKQVDTAYQIMETRQAPPQSAADYVPISLDSYLEVGEMIGELAYVYDRFYDDLTPQERTRWENYANQTLFNVWNPTAAFWARPSTGVHASATWSGWGTDQPGNNYYYSFLKGTMAWALASKNATWLALLNGEKLPKLVTYYTKFPGGGSREGTGYGAAHTRLFELYRLWRANTGENLAARSSHALDSLPYWIHATVPTLDLYAPVGDLSRESYPNLFDYHQIIVSELMAAYPGTDQAKWGKWWLDHKKALTVQPYNLKPLLIPFAETGVQPAALVHHSPGAGHLFARDAWTTTAAWMSFVAGRFDESHAHEDQGSFQLYGGGQWLTVTTNIWGAGGLSQGVLYHNGLRFEEGGAVLPQLRTTQVGTSGASSLQAQSQAGVVVVDSDLEPAYSRNGERDKVVKWHRKLSFGSHQLAVADSYQVAAGIKAVFQVQVPVQPVLQSDGSVKAGGLTIRPIGTVRVVLRPHQSVAGTDYYGASRPTWIVELHDGPVGSFDVQLEY